MALLAPGRPGASLRCWAVLAAFAAIAAVAAPPVAVRESEVKAVFLFNFAQFVEWPDSAFAAPDSPLVLAVLGDDPFGPVLDAAVRDEKAGGHPLEVRRYRRLEEVTGCHILYISRSENTRLDNIVGALQSRGILTVSDTDNSARRGVMIRFLNENNRVRLRVNLDRIRQAGLTISSKLLRAADIVGDAQ